MQNELSNDTKASKGKVVLELIGIDKKWVHSRNKGWVEMNERPTESIVTINEVMDESSSKKWWAFWKK